MQLSGHRWEVQSLVAIFIGKQCIQYHPVPKKTNHLWQDVHWQDVPNMPKSPNNPWPSMAHIAEVSHKESSRKSIIWVDVGMPRGKPPKNKLFHWSHLRYSQVMVNVLHHSFPMKIQVSNDTKTLSPKRHQEIVHRLLQSPGITYTAPEVTPCAGGNWVL